jgi:hypothetical protein
MACASVTRPRRNVAWMSSSPPRLKMALIALTVFGLMIWTTLYR